MLAPAARACGDAALLDEWRDFTTSDHVYYMSTKAATDGDVHEYFSPYDSPHDAFLTVMNAVADMLYYLKYSFIGDGIRNDVENIVRQLRPALKLRLRFIAGHSRDETPQT